MLVLTRKCGESIVIDGKIKIKIMDVSDEKVKIGIAATVEMKVYRKELFETLKENKSAADNAAADVIRSIALNRE